MDASYPEPVNAASGPAGDVSKGSTRRAGDGCGAADADADDVTLSRGATRWRAAGLVALLIAMGVAVWSQRATVGGAIARIGTLPIGIVAVLVGLAVYERWARADVVRRLLGAPVGIGTGLVIHDTGTAVSKGVPLGGALGTALRWSIARESGVRCSRFATMLIAFGIATTFVSWLLPFGALVVDLTQRPAEVVDVLILCGLATVLLASATFWVSVLRSKRLEAWATARLRGVWARLARRVPSAETHDPAAGVGEVRGELHAIVRRPWSLLVRVLGAQLAGAVILLVSLRSLGVGAELGTTEFFRVFFIAHLLGTFAPTPGGVGVMEAGLTGALMAAGVDTTAALAGVLVYRFLTYVVPIVVGVLLYVGWRIARTSEPPGGRVGLRPRLVPAEP